MVHGRLRRRLSAGDACPGADGSIVGALPFWEALRHREGIRRALAGVNAAVVGILGAALYDPVWTGAIHSRADFCLALAAYGLLVVGRVPPVAVVAFCAAVGCLSGLAR